MNLALAAMYSTPGQQVQKSEITRFYHFFYLSDFFENVPVKDPMERFRSWSSFFCSIGAAFLYLEALNLQAIFSIDYLVFNVSK